MPALPDGTIIPSFLGVKPTGVAGNPGDQTNVSLRWGEVVEVWWPGDPQNINQRRAEYTVRVQHKDGAQAGASVLYRNVQLSTLFGGAADAFRYTLRVSSSGLGQPSPGQLGDGSKVLLACLNGDKHQAEIVGGVSDNFGNQTTDSQSLGHNLSFEFNGLNVVITDAGELSVTRRGATNADDTVKDDQNGGANVLFSSDGNITVTAPDAKQSIQLDFAAHKLHLVADQEMTVTSNGQVNIQSTGVVVGSGSNAWLLATTYRQNQAAEHQSIVDIATTLSSLMETAAAALTTAGPLLATPIIGGTLASPSITTAAVAMTSMVPIFAQWGEAVQIFESTPQAYLSTKNTND